MKILVISLAGIGDTLLATPLIHELRLNFPGAVIDCLVLWPGSRDILETNPHINTLLHKHLIKDSRLSSVLFLRNLRENGYDLSINTHPQSRIHYRIAAWLAGAPKRISHQYECFTALDRMLINRSLPQDYSRNTADQNLDILPLLGKARVLQEHRLELFLTETDRSWADAFIGSNNLESRPLIGIHAGSGGTKNLKLKRWPLTHWIELLQQATRQWPEAAFLLFGGPDENQELQTLIEQTGSSSLFRVQGKLRAAAALMQRLDAFLSVDTALMHVAAAARVRGQIVIEAPTFNKTNEPYHQHYTLIPNPAVNGRNLEYYRYDGRSIKGSTSELKRCMASITPDAVLQALVRVLGK